MNKREFSAKTSWDLYEEHKATKGAKSIGRNQHVSTTVSKKFAQNKGQLPDLEMGRKQKQTKKSTYTKPTKNGECCLHARQKQINQNAEKSSHKCSILKILCWKLRCSYIREHIIFQSSRIKCYKDAAMAIRYPPPPNPFRSTNGIRSVMSF